MDGPARRPVGGRRRPILDPRCECFKIGEVARGLDITPSAIRFYQKRFSPHIRPTKIPTKSKRESYRYVYSRRDVQILKVILVLRRDHGLSVRDARERLHDLLVTHHGDPFAIERDLVPPREEPRLQGPGWFPDQGELPLEAPAGPSSVGPAHPPGPDRAASGVREPTADARALEHEVAAARSALEARERELADARRTVEEQSARLREVERGLQRLRSELGALRLGIRQAVRELLLDGSEE